MRKCKEFSKPLLKSQLRSKTNFLRRKRPEKCVFDWNSDRFPPSLMRLARQLTLQFMVSRDPHCCFQNEPHVFMSLLAGSNVLKLQDELIGEIPRLCSQQSLTHWAQWTKDFWVLTLPINQGCQFILPLRCLVPPSSLELTSTSSDDDNMIILNCVANGVFPAPSISLAWTERFDILVTNDKKGSFIDTLQSGSSNWRDVLEVFRKQRWPLYFFRLNNCGKRSCWKGGLGQVHPRDAGLWHSYEEGGSSHWGGE